MSNAMIKLAIFASGNGTNAENIVKYFERSSVIMVDSIYTNKHDAYVLKRAEKMNIDSFYYSNKEFIDGIVLLKIMQDRGIDYIILAGFLLKIPDNILKSYPNKILNIHPALLPKFGGKGMYGDVVHKAVKEACEKESGITIHLVNERYDEGTTIFQKSCKLSNSDSYTDIANKVHKLEYIYFPKVIEEFCSK